MSQNEQPKGQAEALSETELNEAELESVAGGAGLIDWIKEKADAVVDTVNEFVAGSDYR